MTLDYTEVWVMIISTLVVWKELAFLLCGNQYRQLGILRWHEELIMESRLVSVCKSSYISLLAVKTGVQEFHDSYLSKSTLASPFLILQ